MLIRDYGFLKHRYRELLLPTILSSISDKLCVIFGMILIGHFVNSLLLSALNLASPFILACTIIYTLFGLGGSLLALRAKASNDDEKSDYYFTISLISTILIVLAYVLIVFLFAEDIFIYIFNVPREILPTAMEYIRTLIFFLPFYSYMALMAYYIRADGYPNLMLVSFLLADFLSLAVSFVLISVFNMGVLGSALGNVIAYVVGALYMTSYFFRKNRNFQ